MNKNEIAVIDEQLLKDKIYTIRGQQVMLDCDLAEIYGYTTKAFNQQVKNNIGKFDVDFRFQLTEEEADNLRSNYLTSSWGGSRYLPYAFTEQGIYMLMTVLRGDLAVQQSKALIRLFKQMKDYIVQQPQDMTSVLISRIAVQTNDNTEAINEIRKEMVRKSELSEMIRLFDAEIREEEVLVLDGEPLKADLAYQKIYAKAKKNIIVIDDYISVKTLCHLAHAKDGVSLTVISDNKGNQPLRKSEYDDYLLEYPGRSVQFIRSSNKVHDRFIILDHGCKNMSVYHCGASSKDAGKKIIMIMKTKDTKLFSPMIHNLLSSSPLVLK